MPNEMSRREFLKVSATTGAALVVGGALPGKGLEANGAMKIPEVEKATVTIITDNYYDGNRPDYKIAKRYRMKPGGSVYNFNLHAEHGLSYYVETVVDGKSHSFMFDYGLDFQGVSRNIELLNIDFKILEALGLSHGHFDHWGTLIALLKTHKEKMTKGIPLYVGKSL